MKVTKDMDPEMSLDKLANTCGFFIRTHVYIEDNSLWILEICRVYNVLFQEKNAEVPFQQSFENGRSSREVRKEPRKLSNFEIARYSRQLILPELGVKGVFSILF